MDPTSTSTFDFEGAKARGLNEDRIRAYLRSKGRESEADAYFGPKKPNIVSQQRQEEKQGIMSRLFGAVKETAQDVVDTGKDIYRDVKDRSDEFNKGVSDTLKGKQSIAELPLQLVGNAAGGVADIAGDLIKGGSKVIAPQAVEDAVGSGVSKAVGAVADTAVPQWIMDKYRTIQEKDPALARDIDAALGLGEFALTMFGAPVAGAGANATGRAAREGIKDFIKADGKGAAAAFERELKAADSIIDTVADKAIKPTTRGKKFVGDIVKYKDNFRSAVKDIVENKTNLNLVDDAGDIIDLPKTPQQFADAISQTKKTIFDEYSTMAGGAENAGLVVKTESAVKELENLLNEPYIRDFHPEAKAYLERNIETLKNIGQYSPEEAQKLIQSFNRELDPFYRSGGQVGDATRAAIQEKIVGALRNGLDDAIESLPENAKYSILKQRYGALKAIEQDVVRRAMTVARQNVKGLIDYADIFNNGQILSSLLTLSPKGIIQGATGKFITNYYKALNSPDAMIESMFKKLGELGDKAAEKGVNLRGVPLPPQ